MDWIIVCGHSLSWSKYLFTIWTLLWGKKIITFSDGSVWQQSDSAYLKIEEGQQVSIERGLLGSFYLSVEGINKRMKVKRVK